MVGKRFRKRANKVTPPIGAALGGGGARGLAHVGVLRAFDRYPAFRPSIWAGTSVGAVVAVLAASGRSTEEIEKVGVDLEWFRDVVKISDLVDRGSPHGVGLLPNTRLGELVNELIDGRSFDELEQDVAIVAADIEHRRRIVMTSKRVAERIDHQELELFLPPPGDDLPGVETVVLSDVTDVGLAVRASSAIPGVLRSVEVNGMDLVDGGIIDQTPVDLARAMGARFTFGISLSLSFMPHRLANPLQAVGGTMGMMGIHQLRRSLDLADVGFQVSGIEGRSPFKPHQTDLIGIGESDMVERLKNLTI